MSSSNKKIFRELYFWTRINTERNTIAQDHERALSDEKWHSQLQFNSKDFLGFNSGLMDTLNLEVTFSL
jgi:hypothetical protein